MLTIDTANSCRICMISTSELESIFLIQDGRATSEIIAEISSVSIDKDDNLSKKICFECREKSIVCQAFRQLCIDSDETVRYNLLLAEQSEGECNEDPENDKITEDTEDVNEDTGLMQLDDEEECFIEEDVDITMEDPNILEIYIDGDSIEKSLDTKNLEHENTIIIERIDSKNYIKPKYSFESHDDLTEKMREAHFAKEQMKKHKCPYCYKSFMFPSKVNRHVSAVHKNMNETKKVIKKNHHCHICNKAFVSQFKVRRHMVVHDTELKTGLQKNWSKNYFLCESCKKKFHTRTTFDRHTMICSMLIKSTITRHQAYEYICVICSDTFKAHDDMIDHMKGNHDQTAEHQCQLCNEFTGGFQEIIKHGKYHEENATHKCCVCQKFFPDGDEIMMHLLRHADYKPYACTFEGCGKTFFDKYKLRQHSSTHDPNASKNYVCDYCQKAFAQMDYLNCHIRRKHTAVKPYCCSYCNRSFAFVHDLNLHLTNHTGNKKHVCQVCDASFTKAWSLKQHLQLHEVNADYESELKEDGKDQTMMEESHITYQCSDCNVEYKTEDAMRAHMEEIHNQYAFIDSNNGDFLAC